MQRTSGSLPQSEQVDFVVESRTQVPPGAFVRAIVTNPHQTNQ